MNSTITLTAIESPNLDVVTYRGSAPLSVLTMLSQADVYDQDENPAGLQRDLNRRHALDAYDYASRRTDKTRPRAFPEVILNVRKPKAVAIEATDGVATLTFDAAALERAHTSGKAKDIVVSRVDGNHRLFYGAGDGKDRPPLEDVMVPFSITVGLKPEQEAGLFLDVNAEQKGLNTSHLHVLRSAITPEDVELELHPERVMTRWLATDEASPLCGMIHMGGSKAGAKAAGIRRPVTFASVESSVKRVLRSEELQTLTDPRTRYEVIRRYSQAVQAALPEAFETPSEYMVLKNIGLQALGTLGARIIDRQMARGELDFDKVAAATKTAVSALDWHKDSSDLAGMSGNRAALLLAGRMKEALDAGR